MGYFIKGDRVPTLSRPRWWSVSSLQTQRQKVGLSLISCAFLLNMHETSLMNLEMGAALPTGDVLGRMQLLGFALDDITEEAVIVRVSSLEQAVYQHLASLPLMVRQELNDDLTFYLSSKRLFDEVVRREVVLSTLLDRVLL